MHIAGWLIVLIAVFLAVFATFVYRRRRILILRGAIEMSVHRGRGLRGGWALGVARYSVEYLDWYRLTSLRAGPSLRLSRRNTTIEDRREPRQDEAVWMPPDSIVLQLETTGGEQVVAVPKSALPGLLSWWESAPPSWMSVR